MTALFILIDQIISLYVYTLFAYVIISWLVALRILNPWQPFVRMATNFLGRIHEPLLGRVRRFMPDLGGIDISPVILLLGAEFLRNLIGGWQRESPVGGVHANCKQRHSKLKLVGEFYDKSKSDRRQGFL